MLTHNIGACPSAVPQQWRVCSKLLHRHSVLWVKRDPALSERAVLPPGARVDRIAMARMHGTACLCLLGLLACSISCVMARDQVDVAGLPVEVGFRSAGVWQSSSVT